MHAIWIAAALADTVPLDFTPPEQTRMFEQVRLTKAVGKVKGKDCAGALAAARADLARVMGKNPAKLPDVPFSQGYYLFLAGNDVFDLGQGSEMTIPAGTVWFDEVGVTLQALGAYEAYQANAFLPMLKPATIEVNPSERKP